MQRDDVAFLVDEKHRGDGRDAIVDRERVIEAVGLGVVVVEGFPGELAIGEEFLDLFLVGVEADRDDLEALVVILLIVFLHVG